MTSVAAFTVVILVFPAFGITAFAGHGLSAPDSVENNAPVVNGVKKVTTSLEENSVPVGYRIVRDNGGGFVSSLCDVQDKPAVVTINPQPGVSVSRSPLIFNDCNVVQFVTFKATDGRAFDLTAFVTVRDQQGNFYDLETHNARVVVAIAPKVVSTNPANGATGVQINSPITATFSESVTLPSVNGFTVKDESGATVAGSVSGTGSARTFTPSSNLAHSTTYTATLAGTITDSSGNTLYPGNTLSPRSYSWSFTTGAASDTTAPQVSSTNPADGTTDVPINTEITATFSEDVTGVDDSSFTVNGVTGDVAYDSASRTATLTPSSNLAYETQYTASLSSPITDLSNNALTQTSWSFTTGAAPDTTAPTVTETVPEDGATNVAIDIGAITATFSEPVQGVDQNSFRVNDGDDNVGGSVSLSSDGLAATFSPTSDLQYSRTYTATLAGTITDLANNALTATDWSFTTGAAPDVTAPTITAPAGITQEAVSAEGSQVTYQVTATDEVDGPVEVTCSPVSDSTFPVGQTTVSCTAEDSKGNSAEKSFTITVQDTTAPDVEITEAADRRRGVEITDGGTTPIPYIQITFEAADAVGIDKTECSLDGRAFTSCESPVAYDRLSRGSHEVTVRATDAAGNTGEDEFTWTVGNAAPTRGQPLAAEPAAETQSPPATEEEEQDDEENTSSSALEEPATESEDVEGNNENVNEPDTVTGDAGATEGSSPIEAESE